MYNFHVILFFILGLPFLLISQGSNEPVYYFPMDNNIEDDRLLHHGEFRYTTGIDGEPESALKFNGIDNFLEILDSSDFNPSEYTISLWVKIPKEQKSTHTTSNAIISKWITDNGDHNKNGFPFTLRVFNQNHALKGQILHEELDGLTSMCGNKASIIPDLTLNDDQFHHIVMMKNNGSISLYVDCKRMSTLPVNNSCSSANEANIFIGARNEYFHYYVPNYFTGVIDELRFYDKALDETEIEALCGVSSLPCSSVVLNPNPFTDFINFPDEYNQGSIYDLTGRFIYKGILDQFDFSRLKNGYYIIKLDDCDKNHIILKAN